MHSLPSLIFDSLRKSELQSLADRVVENDALSIDFAVSFFAQETKGLWHNRARAMLARRFKHCTLSEVQVSKLQTAVFRRLESGDFFEQFRDQLKTSFVSF